ncbi:RagB/SusD family nutrient uptake outer membrane protein [Carboxylicivirga sp. RSCT41]|uniref:RagB/SusD family nutrient uptake outer membrane protein n=1 Tax=Carboxylicivirga agarovorans TaxID=3417570 RepID=UPI003D3286B4
MKKYILILLLSCLLLGCKDFLEEVDQDKLIPTTTEHYAATMLGKNSRFLAEFEDLMTEFMTDNLDEYPVAADNTKRGSKTLYTWQREIELDDVGEHVETNNTWESSYNKIAIFNYMIEMVEDAIGEQDEKDYIIGEAYFLRAYQYFILTNLYGVPYNSSTANIDLGVPLRLGTGLEQTYNRSSVKECYEQIIRDLETAREYIEKSGVEKSKWHPTVSACDLLLSRTYLYMEQWDKAEQYATAVIESNDLPFMKENSVYIAENKAGVLFSYGESVSYSFNTQLDIGGYRVSQDLIELYHPDDNRLGNFFYEAPGKLFKVYYPSKREMSFTSLGKSNLHVTEAYLNRAEARYNNGGDAASDLRTLLESRYSNKGSIVIEEGPELHMQILTERRKELCFEEQHRWFDLRRMKDRPTIGHYYSITDNSGRISSTQYYELQPEDLNYTLPIPLYERDNNPLIRNNERMDKLPVTY